MGYFNPWRRKIGVLTLVMALPFALVWVRSFGCTDQIYFEIGEDSSGEIHSSEGELELTYRWVNANGMMGTIIIDGPSDSETLQPREAQLHQVGEGMKWESHPIEKSQRRNLRRSWFRFGTQNTELSGWTVMIVPYWLIVVPLTVFSAYLLLSKSRKKPASPKN